MIHNDSMYFNVFQFQCRSSNSWAFSYCNCSPLLHSSRHLASQENSAVPRCATRHLVWPMPEQLSSWWKSVSYGFVWKFGTNQFLVDHDVSSFSYMFLLEIFEIAITWGYPSFFGKSILGGSVSIGLHLNHPFFWWFSNIDNTIWRSPIYGNLFERPKLIRLRSAPLICCQRCIACFGDAEIPPDASLETMEKDAPGKLDP